MLAAAAADNAAPLRYARAHAAAMRADMLIIL